MLFALHTVRIHTAVKPGTNAKRLIVFPEIPVLISERELDLSRHDSIRSEIEFLQPELLGEEVYLLNARSLMRSQTVKEGVQICTLEVIDAGETTWRTAFYAAPEDVFVKR
jgi:hypothetical protein